MIDRPFQFETAEKATQNVSTRTLIKMIENLPIDEKAIEIPVEIIKRGTTRS